MARRTQRQRATDRLNLALARIEAMTPHIGTIDADSLRKQIIEAINEAYTALGEIRSVIAAI